MDGLEIRLNVIVVFIEETSKVIKNEIDYLICKIFLLCLQCTTVIAHDI